MRSLIQRVSARYLARHKLTISAEDLCRALYGSGVETVNKGFYAGTRIPLRPVPKNAMLSIEDRGTITVTDDQGGWIADRITEGVLGRREFAKVLSYLGRVASRKHFPFLREDDEELVSWRNSPTVPDGEHSHLPGDEDEIEESEGKWAR